MGSIRFRCPHCERKLEVDARGAGRQVPCPECGRAVDIPVRAQTVRLLSRSGADEPSTMWIRVARPLRPLKDSPGALMWVLLCASAYVIFLWPVIRPWAVISLLGSLGLAMALLVRRELVAGAAGLLITVILSVFVFVDMLLPKPPGQMALAPGGPKATRAPVGQAAEARPAPADRSEAAPVVVSEPAERPRKLEGKAASASGPIELASIPRSVPRAVRGARPQAVLNPDGPQTFPFRLYGDCDDGMFPYYPYGWMGNIDAIDLNECWEENPHSGRTCMKFAYNAVGRWAGVAWQDPANNWGDTPGGYNLTGATKLTFWVRGETGFERAEFKVGLLGVGKKYNDTAKRSLGKVQLYKEWHQYTISLEGMNMGRIITAFLWVVEGGPRPVVFYIDDVQFE